MNPEPVIKIRGREQEGLISIIIPIYNEGRFLKTLLFSLLSGLKEKNIAGFEIILVENGSADNTPEVANSIIKDDDRIKILSLGHANYGEALRKGMLAARGQCVITFDLDYTDADFIIKSSGLLKKGFDLVIASKNNPLSNDRRSYLRKIISQAHRFVILFLFRLKFTDTHGMKAWKSSAKLNKLINLTKFNGNIFDTELIIRANNSNFAIIELPANLSEKRPSTSNIVIRIFDALWDLARLFYQLNFIEKLNSRNTAAGKL